MGGGREGREEMRRGRNENGEEKKDWGLFGDEVKSLCGVESGSGSGMDGQAVLGWAL